MKEYWTMRDGTKINVDDMTESHLRNTLKMIIRNKDAASLREPFYGLAKDNLFPDHSVASQSKDKY